MALSKFTQLNDRAQPHSSQVQARVNQVVEPVATAVNATPIGGAAPPAWIRPNFGTSWADLNSSGSAVLAFHKDALGYVHLKGVIANTSGAPNAGTICTLPLGCRPLELHEWPARAGAGFSFFAIDQKGIVSPPGGVAAGDFLVLQAIFLAGA